MLQKNQQVLHTLLKSMGVGFSVCRCCPVRDRVFRLTQPHPFLSFLPRNDVFSSVQRGLQYLRREVLSGGVHPADQPPVTLPRGVSEPRRR